MNMRDAVLALTFYGSADKRVLNSDFDVGEGFSWKGALISRISAGSSKVESTLQGGRTVPECCENI